MHEYDIALKDILLDSAGMTLRELTGLDVTMWRDVELPEVTNPRIDLLGETGDGTLVHIELQSTNDPKMALRMLDYGLRVYKQHEKFPRQTVLYLGEAPLHMSDTLTLPGLSFQYRVVDIRELDGERLCESGAIGDNVIAILARWSDGKEAVRRILRRIAAFEPAKRGKALAQVLILAGLRSLATEVEKEARHMPILNDILDHPVLGREYKRGELNVLRRILVKRFGPIPAWAEERLAQSTVAEIERLAELQVDAASLEELLR
jgi:hypothetical protein